MNKTKIIIIGLLAAIIATVVYFLFLRKQKAIDDLIESPELSLNQTPKANLSEVEKTARKQDLAKITAITTFPLKFGSKNISVKLLQRFINNAFKPAIKLDEDGKFGRDTETYLLKYLYVKQVTKENLEKFVTKLQEAGVNLSDLI